MIIGPIPETYKRQKWGNVRFAGEKKKTEEAFKKLQEVIYKEYELELPRAADLTYSIGLSKDFSVGGWSASSRVSYSYRDPVAYDDANLGT